MPSPRQEGFANFMATWILAYISVGLMLLVVDAELLRWFARPWIHLILLAVGLAGIRHLHPIASRLSSWTEAVIRGGDPRH